MMEYIYHGLDFGFAVDPLCFMRVSYDRKHDTVYFLDEIYERGWSNAKLAEEIIRRGYDRDNSSYYSVYTGQTYSGGQKLLTADCAEPKSISDLRQCGLRVAPCHKEPGCVEYRVKWLQHRKIVIDPRRTPNAYREFVGYSYATDKDGNFVSVLPDRDNHSIDAVAYALNGLIYFNKKGATA